MCAVFHCTDEAKSSTASSTIKRQETYAKSISCVSKAPIVCSTALAAKLRRSKTRVHSISPGHRIRIGNTEILGIEVQHGPIIAFRRTNISFKPKMVGVGSIWFYFNIGNHTFLNLGDTLFLRDRSKDIKPDVLMVPVGGLMTMDLGEAISAIQEIRPKTIVPVHYDWHLLVYHRKTNLERLETAMHDMRIAYCNIPPGAQAEI